jgi:hypothetical protein
MKNFHSDRYGLKKLFDNQNIQTFPSNLSMKIPISNTLKSPKTTLGIFYYDFHGDIKIFDESLSNRRGIVINLHI